MTTPTTDAGRQPERTELAWRRTSAALVIVCLLILRLIGTHAEAIQWVLAVIIVAVLIGAVGGAAHRRTRSTRHMMNAGTRRPLPGGGLLAVMGASTVLCGVIGTVLAFVVQTLPA